MYPYIHILGREIGAYGLCMLLGFSLAAVLALFKGKPKGLIAEDLLIVGAFTLGFALIGGSLLYSLVTYSPTEIVGFICSGDFSFLGNGIVFYGGLIGGIFGAFLGIRVAQCSIALIEKSVVPFIPLGHAVGRIGCVMAGCCHGFAYDGPLALYYPSSVIGLSQEQGYFPVQPLESLINIGLCLFLLRYEKRAKYALDTLFMYLGSYGISRFFLEMLRGDAARGIWNALSTSQIISILLLCISLMRMLWKKKSSAEQALK